MAFGEDLGEAVLHLVTDPAKLRAGMAAAREETLSTLNSANGALRDIGGKMTATGGQMTRGITVPVLAAGAAIVGVGGEFEHTLSKIVGLVGVNREQINAWKPEIEDLARSTGIGPNELAKGLYFVASSGIEASKAMGVLTIAAKASEAGMGDVEMLADVLTGTMNAYAKSNLTAAHAMDVLVRGIQVGKAEPAAFASAMGTVAPIAAQLNVKVEDLVGTLAVLSRTNSNTAENATSLGQVLNTLLKPTAQTAEALSKMGLSAGGLRKELADEGLLAVLKTLAEHIGDDDEAIAQIFPNIRALRGVLNLTGQDAASVAEAMAKVGDASGALDAAVQAVADDASVKMNKALASMQVELVILSSDVLPLVVSMLSQVVTGVHDVVTWFTSLPAPVKAVIVQGIGLLAVLGPILVILGSITSAAGGLIGAFGGVAGFLTATLIPRMAAFIVLLATGPIEAFAGVIFATGIPALERLAIALLGVEAAAAPLLLIAAAVIAIGVAASGAAPSLDEMKKKLKELDADHGWGRNQEEIDLLTEKIAELESAIKASADRMSGMGDHAGKMADDVVSAVTRMSGTEANLGKLADDSVTAGGLVAHAFDKVAPKGAAAVASVKKTLGEMADAIRTGRRDIVDAMNQTIEDAYDPLILAAEISATKTELAAERRIAAERGYTQAQIDFAQTHAKTAAEKAAADRMHTQAEIDEAKLRVLELKKQLGIQLNDQTQYGTDAQRLALLTGRATSSELVAGLKSGDEARRLASEAAATEIASGIIALMNKTHTYGVRTGNHYVDGLIAAFEERVDSIKRAFQPIVGFFRASSPPGPESPLHEIGLWGRRTGEEWINPFAGAIAAARASLRRLIGGVSDDLKVTPATPSIGLAERASRTAQAAAAALMPASMSPALAGAGPGGGGGDTYIQNNDVKIEGLLKARDSFEVADQLKRIAGRPRKTPGEKK